MAAAPKKAARKAVVVDTPLEGEVVDAAVDGAAAFAMFGQDWIVGRRPPALMLARMQRVEFDADAIAILDQMVEHCLGPEQYRPFMSAYYAASPVDGNDGELFTELLGHIMQAATGRPPQ
mgnify:CR=1 FL=1